MKAKILACLSALAVFGLASHASAATAVITYQGVLAYDPYDGDDLFGGDLTNGEAMTAIFDYNTALGTRTSSPISDVVSGDYPYNTSFPVTSATLEIGTYRYSISPDYQADAETGQQLYDNDLGGYFNGILDDAETFSGDDMQVGIVSDRTPPVSLAQSYTSTGSGFGDLTTGDDSIDFFTTSVRVSAAPEPGSWALMVAGIGGIGLMLRRAKQRTGFRFRDALSA